MQYTSYYHSPIGRILLASDDLGLTGLWFEGQKYFADGLDTEHRELKTPLLEKAKSWLTVYFSGKEPDFSVPLHLQERPFSEKSGKFSVPFPTDRLSLTVRLLDNSPPKRAFLIYLPRQSAAL